MFNFLAIAVGLLMISKPDNTPAQQSVGTVVLSVGVHGIVRAAEKDPA